MIIVSAGRKSVKKKAEMQNFCENKSGITHQNIRFMPFILMSGAAVWFRTFS